MTECPAPWWKEEPRSGFTEATSISLPTAHWAEKSWLLTSSWNNGKVQTTVGEGTSKVITIQGPDSPILGCPLASPPRPCPAQLPTGLSLHLRRAADSWQGSAQGCDCHCQVQFWLLSLPSPPDALKPDGSSNTFSKPCGL